MANYDSITISGSFPASGLIYLDYSSDDSWITHGRTIDVGIDAPDGAEYTQYLLWGYENVTTSGDASWENIPASGTITVPLADQPEPQTLYVKFRTAGLEESPLIGSEDITFLFTTPTKSAALSWISLTDEDSTSAILRDTTYNIDLTFDKSNLSDLRFHNRNFSGIRINNDVITVTADSQIWKLVEHDADGYVSIKKTFDESYTPFIRANIGEGFKTLTTYSGTIRSDMSGDYLNRIAEYDWNSSTKELTFDVYKFSSYGFTTINTLQFTLDSVKTGYIDTDISLVVKVTDTGGSGVEGAPVTFSGTGTAIGSLSANPVYTDVNGIATVILSLDTLGSITYDASCDGVHTSVDQITWCYPAVDGQRSFIEQNTQVNGATLNYDDTISGTGTQAVAEPSSVAISLGHDLNVIRTLMKNIKGTDDWYSDLGNYFDPTSTTSGGAENTVLNLTSIKNNTLDSKTVIIAVEADNSGAGFDISTSASGFLYTTGLSYASWTDRRGFPIFASTSNPDDYFDIGGIDEVCVIDLIDTTTGVEFKTTGGDLIYAKFHDAADFGGGTGDGTDIYVRFYADGSPYTWTGTDPSNIMIIFPFRRVMNEMEEYEWTRTDFVNGFEGDTELLDDISNLWSFTGASNAESDPTWTNISGSYILDDDPTSLESGIDLLNTEIGDRTYTASGTLTNGQTIAASLDALGLGIQANDAGILANESGISANDTDIGNLQTAMGTLGTDISNLVSAIGSATVSGLDYSSNNYVVDGTSIETAIGILDAAISVTSVEKYIEELASDVDANVVHPLPDGVVYTPNYTSGSEGSNMDVWVEGQFLCPDTGVSGVNMDRDYAETSASGITFRFNIDAGSNITYMIYM